VEDLPIHELSEETALQAHMASFFGLSSWADYHRQLKQLRQKIDHLFQHLFADVATVDVVLSKDEQRKIQKIMREMPLQRLPKSTAEKVHALFRQVTLMARTDFDHNQPVKRTHTAAPEAPKSNNIQSIEIPWQRLTG